MKLPEILYCIQIVAIFIQVAVIVWVARQWREQKKEERYADQCHLILKDWSSIDRYWDILIGDGIYPLGIHEGLKKLLKENGDCIMRFRSFLRYPKFTLIQKMRCL